MPLIQKARTGTGCFVQIIGGLLWLVCGLATCIWSYGIIIDAFGFWVFILTFWLFPVVFLFAPLIAWLQTGTFPLGILVLWLLTLGGSVIAYAGSRIKGEEL